MVDYEELLNVAGNGVISYMDIPSFDARLPIYHYMSESVLWMVVGYLHCIGLLVGKPDSYCVLSGHNGLSAYSVLM